LLRNAGFSIEENPTVIYMPSFYGIMRDILSPYYKYIVFAVILVIFGVLLRYLYNKHVIEAKKTRKFNDVANANTRGEELPIYFFHTDWCPHCKTAMPEWRGFRDAYHDKQVMGYNVRCIDINCTAEDAKTQSVMNKYDIDSFPTVKMVKGGEQIDYDARVTSDNLESFLLTMTASE
jgi:thiol-disulfide isomerase/thioredoxin